VDSSSGENGAHPNSRFTAPASQCPVISPNWEIRRVCRSQRSCSEDAAKLAPLIYESFNWQHGTFVGATWRARRPAATGAVGVVRRDPMAMLPFCATTCPLLPPLLEMGRGFPTRQDLQRQLVQEGRRRLVPLAATATTSGPWTGSFVGAGDGRGRRDPHRLHSRQERPEPRGLEISARPWTSFSRSVTMPGWKSSRGCRKFFDQFGYDLPESSSRNSRLSRLAWPLGEVSSTPIIAR